jgi:nicotinamidase-related amidase
MALSTLDPKTALIIVDLQKGIISLPVARPVEEVVKHARTLADAFRSHELPVVLVSTFTLSRGCPRSHSSHTMFQRGC